MKVFELEVKLVPAKKYVTSKGTLLLEKHFPSFHVRLQ